MGMFEKGQYVRRTKGTSFTTATGHHDAGFVGQIKGIIHVFGREDLLFTNGHKGIADKYEPWQPKVGERVCVKYGHGWDGEAVVDRIHSDITFIVTMKAGSFVDQEGGFRLADLEPLPVPTALTIEAGKFYKTRDGRKVGPAEVFYVSGWSGWGLGSFIYQQDGKHGDGDDNHNPRCVPNQPELDLIAEWVDEPAALTPEASNDNSEPVKPKFTFKVGDKAKTRDGRIVTITHVDQTPDYPFAHDMGDGRYHAVDPIGTSCIASDEDDIVEALSEPSPAIVALIENGTAKPAARPKVHPDQASATTEAERLALQLPGQRFGVFVLADSKIADLVNVPTAVLRAA